jgi:hypothetical protein
MKTTPLAGALHKNAIPSGDGVIPKNDFTAEFRSARL